MGIKMTGEQLKLLATLFPNLTVLELIKRYNTQLNK